MFNFQYKKIDSQILIHSCTQKMMSVWLKQSKNTCLRSIVRMESLIRENIGKDPVRENGQT